MRRVSLLIAVGFSFATRRVKQVAKGYFHDYNELRHQGGKAWIAPNTLIREDVSLAPSLYGFLRHSRLTRPPSRLQLSLYFPNIEGTRLSDRAKTHTVDVLPGKVSVVVFSSFKSSEVGVPLEASVLATVRRQAGCQATGADAGG